MKALQHAFRSLGLLAACALASSGAHAALSSFTSKAAFDAAIGALGAIQTVDFEANAAGDTFASGTGTGGLTFVYSIADPSTLQVSATFGTTSGSNYLGLDNADTAFYLGDSFTIDFNRTVHAVGLYVIAGNDAQAGDVQLSVTGGSVSNAAVADTLVSDGQAFWLGLVESDINLGFTSASVSFLPDGDAFLAVTVDDITSGVIAVPEPETWALMLVGLGALATLRRRAG